jgi:hypothetical protein
VPGTVFASIEPVALLPVMSPTQFAVYVALRSSGPVPPIPVRSIVKEKCLPSTLAFSRSKGALRDLGASSGGMTLPENEPSSFSSVTKESRCIAVYRVRDSPVSVEVGVARGVRDFPHSAERW